MVGAGTAARSGAEAPDEGRRHLEAVAELDAARRQNATRVLAYVERLAGAIPPLATELLGSEDAAAEWLMQPVLALGYKRPIDRLGTDAGREEVELLLLRLQHGVYV
ncbi:DUF2384 domain-containing protein [Roseomonas nepalensis]|uniref:DUF2384 domain-containing protein n=1 Tax=Muricoccus nepalensis TaxID=1854500 RepID=A0A502ELT3_9PROT|nr:DUF2384 domain-containing protein [Roseomonas nepalensis]